MRPAIWGEPGDQARIERSLNEDIPSAVEYLEGELPADGFLFGEIGVADISIASFFLNGAYAGFEPDPERWPRTAAFVERTLAHPCIAPLLNSKRFSAVSTSNGGARRCSTRGLPDRGHDERSRRAAARDHAALAAVTPRRCARDN